MPMTENQMIIKNARLAFPELWTPVEFEPGDGRPRYSATLLIAKDDPQVATITALGLKMFQDEFKAKEGGVHYEAVKSSDGKYCLSDGDKKVFDGFAGNMSLSAHRSAESGAPMVVDRNKEKLKATDGKPYAGCYVNAKVSFWVQDNKFGKGFRCTLETIQFVKDGDAFSGAAPATAEGLDEIEDEAEDLV